MEYKCVGGHDLCATTLPCRECPYCERQVSDQSLRVPSYTEKAHGVFSNARLYDLVQDMAGAVDAQGERLIELSAKVDAIYAILVEGK